MRVKRLFHAGQTNVWRASNKEILQAVQEKLLSYPVKYGKKKLKNKAQCKIKEWFFEDFFEKYKGFSPEWRVFLQNEGFAEKPFIV